MEWFERITGFREEGYEATRARRSVVDGRLDSSHSYKRAATQGPACAMAAGAGTIYRNYFAPVGGLSGQREARQIDCLSDIGIALGNVEGRLWQMRNGCCFMTDDGLARGDEQLSSMDPGQVDELRGRLHIGVHWGMWK